MLLWWNLTEKLNAYAYVRAMTYLIGILPMWQLIYEIWNLHCDTWFIFLTDSFYFQVVYFFELLRWKLYIFASPKYQFCSVIDENLNTAYIFYIINLDQKQLRPPWHWTRDTNVDAARVSRILLLQPVIPHLSCTHNFAFGDLFFFSPNSEFDR